MVQGGNEPYVLAIDIGTESSRACLIDKNARLVDSARVTQELGSPQKGWAEQEPSLWWNNTRQNIRNLVEREKVSPENIEAIGVCGQMHAPVAINKGGDVVDRPTQLWCDKRTGELTKELREREPEQGFYKRKVGNIPAPAWSGLKMKWLKRHRPEDYKQVDCFVPPKDYINYELTGELSTDYSEASGSFLMDVDTEDWSDEMIELLEVDKEKLPPIQPSDAVLGGLSQEVAKDLGLKSGIPVVVGGGDMLSTLLGAGIIDRTVGCDTTGTASIFSSFSPDPTESPKVMSLRHVIDGWINFGILDSGGGSLWWFRRLLEQGGDLDNSIDYAQLSEAANRAPVGSKGLYFLPYLQGERVLGSANASGVFFGITPAHDYSDFARAIMEGVTYHLNQTKVLLEDMIDIEHMNSIGGGAKSDIWNRVKANIYGVPVHTLEAFEGGVLGCAFLAFSALGILDGPAGGADKLEVKNRFKPDEDQVEQYQDRFENFQQLHDALQPLFEQIE